MIKLPHKESHNGEFDYFYISAQTHWGQETLCLTLVPYNSLLCSSTFSSLLRNGDGIPSTVYFFP